MKNIAILGATGHIAKNIIFQLCYQRKYKLILFTRSPERMQNFLKFTGQENIDANITIKSNNEFKSGNFNIIINCVGKSNPVNLKAIGSSIFILIVPIFTGLPK